MLITIINGSYRLRGATAKILQRIQNHILQNYPDAEISFINLSEIHAGFCTGCLHCYKTGRCANTKDGMEELHDQIDKSDGVIFGSPTYVGNVTGLFKNFIDRSHMVVEQLLYRKPCIVLTTYENAEGSRALSIIKHTVHNSGGYVCSSLGIKNPFNEPPVTAKLDKKLRKASIRLAETILARKKPPLFSRIYQKAAVHLVMKPLAMRKQEQYQGVLDHWYRKGILS